LSGLGFIGYEDDRIIESLVNYPFIFISYKS